MITHRRDLWKVSMYPGNAAEIGVAEGYFSADMLSWPVNFPLVYMVDRWATIPGQKGDGGHPQDWHERNFDAALERVHPFGNRAVMLRGFSVEMARQVPDGTLGLLYVDGDHSYEGVMADIHAWMPKVIPGGCVAFHDFEAPQYGVKKAVTEYCVRHKKKIWLLHEDQPCDAGAFFYA